MASMFSSLFGVGQQPQQQPQAAAITTQQLPEEIAPYYEKLLKEAEALYKKKMEEGVDKEPEQKGFMARKDSKPKPQEKNMDLIEIVADAIVHVRKKRMELK